MRSSSIWLSGVELLVSSALSCIFAALTFSVLALPLSSLAEGGVSSSSRASAPTPTPYPQRGVLSRSATAATGYNTKRIEGTWAGGDNQGSPPVAGSVSRKSEREWVAKLFNNSEDTYSVSISVDQINSAGKRERSDSFSARLGPQESYERSLRATERTVDAQLNLLSWKNLSEKKHKPEEPTKVEAEAALKLPAAQPTKRALHSVRSISGGTH